ncbi:MAG: SDR family oxidoreductase [Ignavibacteria bacterium]|nr:SDR family oxidoreductase [Ignavibacteria bacterium]
MKINLLKGKVIWISGGSRGIGAAISKKLMEHNPFLFISGTSQDSFKNLDESIKNNPNVFTLPCNVLNEKEIENCVKIILEKQGKIDFLINNAGVLRFNSILDAGVEEFDNQIGVNLKGLFLCIKSVLPSMLEKKSGTIININSVSAIKTYKYNGIYSASKAGALALSRCLREEVRRNGIKVIDIIPGATSTEIWQKEIREKSGSLMMDALDIAEAVAQIVLLSNNKKLMLEEIIIRPQFGDL